jgi:aspartate kinase
VDAIIYRIEDDHLKAAERAIGKEATKILQATKAAIKNDCQRMSGLLKAAMVLDEISDRTTDRVLAFGETLSCRMVAGCLQTKVSCLPTTASY